MEKEDQWSFTFAETFVSFLKERIQRFSCVSMSGTIMTLLFTRCLKLAPVTLYLERFVNALSFENLNNRKSAELFGWKQHLSYFQLKLFKMFTDFQLL